MKNHEVLGFFPTYDVIAWNARCEKQFSSNHYRVANDAKEFAAVAHMGFIDPVSVHGHLHTGIDWILTAFDQKTVTPTNGGWFSPLHRGLLLCFLSRRQSDAGIISRWSSPRRKPEYRGDLPDEVQLMYLYLAGVLDEASASKFSGLYKKIMSSRKRNSRNLRNLLKSIVEKDQSQFDSSLKQCIEDKRAAPKPAQDAFFMEDWLPIHANVFYLLAMHFGLEEPSLDEEQKAYLMTPESVGFV